MPAHIHDEHFNKDETVTLGGDPYILGNAVVYLDSDDGLYKRYTMDKGELVLQYWDGTQFKNV